MKAFAFDTFNIMGHFFSMTYSKIADAAPYALISKLKVACMYCYLSRSLQFEASQRSCESYIKEGPEQSANIQD